MSVELQIRKNEKPSKCINCKVKALTGTWMIGSKNPMGGVEGTVFFKHVKCTEKEHLSQLFKSGGKGVSSIIGWDELDDEEAEEHEKTLRDLYDGKKRKAAPKAKKAPAAKKPKAVKEPKEPKEAKTKAPPKKKAKRDPNKPKAARSAYVFYAEATRPRCKEENPKATTQELMRLVADEWKKADDDDKAPFVVKATADKKRNKEEMKDYVPPEVDSDEEDAPAKKVKAKKDPNAPKRPTSSYFLYMKAVREQVKKDNPDVANKVSEIAKLLGAQWKAEDAETKKPYEDEAAVLKAQYVIEKAKYDEENPVEKKAPVKKASKKAAPKKAAAKKAAVVDASSGDEEEKGSANSDSDDSSDSDSDSDDDDDDSDAEE